MGIIQLHRTLIVKNGVNAIEFYKKVFGANERMRMMTPDGKALAHAELQIGDSVVMLSDEFPEMKCLSPKSIRWKSCWNIFVCRRCR